jgi:hypothetical protein
MPVQDTYLYVAGTGINPGNMTVRNTFLENLNTDVQSLYDRVSKVVVMASTGISTPAEVIAQPHQSSDGTLWVDGKFEKYNYDNGDGTILFSRANLPACSDLNRCFFRSFVSLKHADLIQPDIVSMLRFEVLADLGLPRPTVAALARARTTQSGQSISDELAYVASGPNVELMVQDPIGRQIGYRSDGSFVSTIPDATYTRVTVDGKLVVIPNPINGQYVVQVVALGSSSPFSGGGYSVARGETETEFTGTVNVGTPQQYTHNYSTAPNLFLPFITK